MKTLSAQATKRRRSSSHYVARARGVASEWNNFWRLLEEKTDERANQSSREPVCVRGTGSEARAADHGRSAAVGGESAHVEADADCVRRARSRVHRIRFRGARFDRRRQGRQQAPEVVRRIDTALKNCVK